MKIFAAIVAAWRQKKWARLTPSQQEIRRLVNRMSPEERTELERELNDDSTREFLARTQAEHEARQTKIAEERERRAPEVQAAHAAFIASLLEDKPRKRDVKRKKT